MYKRLLTPQEIIDVGEKCARVLGCIPKALRKSVKGMHLEKINLILWAMKPLGEIPTRAPFPHLKEKILITAAQIKGFAESAAEEDAQTKNPEGKSPKIEFDNISEARTYFQTHLAESRPALLGSLIRIDEIEKNNGIENPLSAKKKEILDKQRMSLVKLLFKRFPSSRNARRSALNKSRTLAK